MSHDHEDGDALGGVIVTCKGRLDFGRRLAHRISIIYGPPPNRARDGGL